mgnify:CR=1 FL=1
MDFGYSKADVLAKMESERTGLESGYSISSVWGMHTTCMIPAYLNASKRDLGVVAARVYCCSKGAKRHNVVIAYDPFSGNYAFWCGDGYLEGTAADKDSRRNQAITFLNGKGITNTSFVKMPGDHLASSGCGFFRSGVNMCKHARGVFEMLHGQAGGIPAVLDEMQSHANTVLGVSGPSAAATTAAAVDPTVAKLTRYAFKRNTILLGPKGWGKSWAVGMYLAENKVDEVVHIGGHEGLESADLIGHMIRTPDGGMAWKDGKLTEAFRWASLSLKTVLFIDEILRIRRREMSVLVASLAPGADGMLRLGTGRPLAVENGLAQEEVLVCDPANLWVVATTNAGAGYEIDDMEEALSDRFPIILSMEGSAAALRAKLGPAIDAKGFPDSVLDKMVKFWATATRLRTQGELNRIVNLRHLSEVIAMADTEGEILSLMEDRIPQWVDRDTDGTLIAAQVKTINTLLKSTFV